MTLCPAEINVLRLIAAVNVNKQIADQLSITEEESSQTCPSWAPTIRRMQP
jgi:DNA-binding CsgD family transcriptional regulator